MDDDANNNNREKDLQPICGNEAFWGIALKKYHQALIGKYHELKIPFRLDRPLKMQDVYVPLKVKGRQNYDLIDAYQAVSQHRRWMVTGNRDQVSRCCSSI
ncbi:MAG: hypothetical protein HC936_11230 [Leptolyngbyaceae cyanobacterium SU_3_3]|nr:hypothetical protein [Leptolyngbyaceae cyanobacterium SU_3_3]